MPRVTFPNWQFQNNTSCKLFWIHWNKKHNQCKVTPVPSPHAQSSCVYHRFPDGAMGGQAALAQDTTSLPDCNPNTSSLLDRALTSPHCHLRVKDYGDRKGITAFPKKKRVYWPAAEHWAFSCGRQCCPCLGVTKTMEKSQECFAAFTWKLVPKSFLNAKTKGHTGLLSLKDAASDLILPQNKYSWNIWQFLGSSVSLVFLTHYSTLTRCRNQNEQGLLSVCDTLPLISCPGLSVQSTKP